MAIFETFEALAAAQRSWNIETIQLDRGPFRGELRQASTRGGMLFEARFDRRLHQLGAPPDLLRTIAILAPPEREALWRGRQVTTRDLMLFPHGGELDCVSGPDFHVVTLSLPEPVLSDLARLHGYDDYDRLVAQREVVRGPTARVEALRGLAIAELDRARIEVDTAAETAARSGIERALCLQAVELLTTGYEHTASPSQRLRDDGLARVLDFVAANPRCVLSVGELSLVARTSRRTLEYAFGERFGVSPKSYLLARRLEGARSDLRDGAGPQTVTRAATSWGFEHMSRFAALYARHFGELPSATLRATRARR